ncbi:hypothetical protein PS6_002903 [Mucor atramentarius]
MTQTRKRKATTEAGPSKPRKPKRTEPPPPPAAAAAVNTELKTRFVSRKCKIGPLLRELYKQTLAEDYSVLRQDAMDFVLLILIQTAIAELLSLIPNINQNIDIDSENITAALQGLTAPINNQLDLLRPHIQDVNDIVHQMHAAVTRGNPDIANVNLLHDRLIHSVTELRPQINAVQALTTQKLQYLRHAKTRIENSITDILDRLTQEERTINNIITLNRGTSEKFRFSMSTLGDIKYVAYGDASIRGTYKGNTPIPVKSAQRAIAEKAIVITVDEFRTSVTCCHCQRRLNNVPSELCGCNHRKKRHRITGVEKRSRMKCIDEEGNIIHLSSQCPDRRLIRQNNTIYTTEAVYPVSSK